MCSPEWYGVDYVINPWMAGNVHRGSRDAAFTQWKELYQKLQTGLPGSSPAATDLSSLGSALGTGDGSSALKAWQAAQTDLGSHGSSAGADQATGGQLLAAYVKNAGLS